ncbi:MAG: heme lyase CcmF/NrfE family subunit [Acidimicrobiales bacterium]
MNVALLGSVAAWSALAMTLVVLVSIARPSSHRNEPGRLAPARSLAGVAVLASMALSCLVWALVRGDYRLVYVAEATAKSASWPYRLAGLWGGMAGSLLFWTWLLSVVAVVATRSVRRSRPDLVAPVAAVLAAMTAAFLAIALVWADPFARLAVPAIDGAGLAPILEHPAMLYHPPLLYLGLVSCGVPFALAVAGLLRSCDQAWLALVRRWAGGAWLVLTVGMLAGAHWAYAELGWGGFWAWDPVENAGLLPWLGATALLHAAMVDEHRGQVRLFTVALALITNVAALVGTLLTRSGAVSSVHAFAEAQAVGRALLAVVVVTAAGSGALLWRSRHRSEAQGSSGPCNRDGAGRRDTGFASAHSGRPDRRSLLTLNAVLVLGVAVVVAFGTLFPLVAEGAGGRPFAVSGRFFALLSAPLALGALGLVGVAPVLRWRGGLTPGGRGALPLAGGAALVAAVTAGVAGLRQPFALAAVPLATFSAVLLVAELARRLRAPGPAVARRRAAGAILAHLGMVILLAGVAGSTVGRTETVVVAPGQEVAVGSYRLRHDGAVVDSPIASGGRNAGILARSGHQNELRSRIIKLDLTLLRGDEEVTVLYPEQRVFEDRGLVLAETALRSTPLEDVLVAIRRIGDDGTAVLEVSVRPLVMWVWLGGILLGAGGALVASPPNRRFDGELDRARAPGTPPDHRRSSAEARHPSL